MMMPPVTFFLFLLLIATPTSVLAQQPEELLSLGDIALAADKIEEAIGYYQQGIDRLGPNESYSLVTALSLYTNLGTSLSSLGQDADAGEIYRRALKLYQDTIVNVVDTAVKSDATSIAAQASFFLGMVYQELDENTQAASSYAYAHSLDPLHWSSLANLGAVLKENLRLPDDALAAYTAAYEILTQSEDEPTDAPPHPEYILAELQYRIGYILMENPARKCAMTDKPDQEVSCQEMASHALSLALKYQPDHESAKHMLATLTADATMKRASNKYVKSLFDDYAKNFEHSLVQELRYNGYERLRRAFDRSFAGRYHPTSSEHHNPTTTTTAPTTATTTTTTTIPMFDVVIDAGCGTGLVGEQFRNVSRYLIGVDLSEVILQEAQRVRPNLYNETLVGDVTQVFVEKKPIALIVAADSYIYFGDLEPLFHSMQKGLQEGGYAAFTLENVDADTLDVLSESKPNWRWQLTASGRFAHNRRYVEEIGKDHDLHLIHYEPLESFRYENGKGVSGHIFILQKQTATDQEL